MPEELPGGGTPQVPAPEVDETSVPQFDEEHEAKAKAHSLAERRRDFFGDDAPPKVEKRTPAPKGAKPAGKKTPAQPESGPDEKPVAAEFLGYMSEEEVGEHAERLVGELDAEAPEGEPASGAPEPEPGTAEAEGEPEGEPSAEAVQDFKNPDGIKYRFRGPDGKFQDVLSAHKGVVYEHVFDGDRKEIPVEKIPNYVSAGLLYHRHIQQIKHDQARLQQHAQQLQDYEANLAEMYEDVERFKRDPEYRERVVHELEQGDTPEARLEEERQRRAELEQQLQAGTEHQQIAMAAQAVEHNMIAPVVQNLVKQAPHVPEEDIRDMLEARLGRFTPGDLKLRPYNGRWVPVNPVAWNEFERVLREELPQRVYAAQRHREQRFGPPRASTNGADTQRRQEAEQEAAITKAELARNAAARRVPSRAGLPATREPVRRPISVNPETGRKDVKVGRQWLSDY